MRFNSFDELRQEGFVGFKTVAELFSSNMHVPTQRGVYLVLYPYKDCPKFLTKGTAGFFKGQDPNVEINQLEVKWVYNTVVLYVGQAGGFRSGISSNQTLNKRIRSLLKFGNGFNIGHYGGRYIWQIKNSTDLVIAWKPLLGSDPKQVESEILKSFIEIYGRRPYANLQG